MSAVGYLASRAPCNGTPVAMLVRRDGGVASDASVLVARDYPCAVVPDDDTVYATEDEARAAAARRWGRGAA